MASGVYLMGAQYSDVPSVELPASSSGGTSSFYDARSVTYSLSGGASASVTPSKVITGGGFSVKLKAPAGYTLSNVSVTMGGVDITSTAFTPDEGGGGGGGSATLITKSITANGTYNASSDSADGYSSVTVNVPNSYAVGDEGKVVSNGALVAQGSDTVTQNGTVDTTLISSLTVNISSGVEVKTKTGTINGNGTITLNISCDFAPDLVYVLGDLSSSNNLRGVKSFTIIKGEEIFVTSDTSTSAANENMYYIAHGITSYNESETSYPHGSYSNNTLTLNMVTNSSSTRFTSGVTYTYKFVKWTS